MCTHRLIIVFLCVAILMGCSGGNHSAELQSAKSAATRDLVVWGWPEDALPKVAEDFCIKYGVELIYRAYESQEEAIEWLQAGERADLVIMDNQLVPTLIDAGLLDQINRGNLPNLRNISASFMSPYFDRENQYSIPYTWGTTGLLVRRDLAGRPVTRWSDLWDPSFAGKIALWTTTPRYTLGIALAMLGFSVNTEDPAELAAGIEKLKEIKDRVVWLSEDGTSAERLEDGNVVIAMGWAYDALAARENGVPVDYVLPEEGPILWSDSFVIPETSQVPYLSEMLLNYLMEAEVNAKLMDLNYYAMPNDPALRLIDRDLFNDPIIFPSANDLEKAQMLQPLSTEGYNRSNSVWERFLREP
jgi:spermidine/putrescine transport system substrate-binding protein